MGSTSPPSPKPQSKKDTASSQPQPQPQPQQQQQEHKNSPTEAELGEQELRHMLENQNKEIQALKFELEKYKLALQQSQLDYHYVQQKQTNLTDSKKSTTKKSTTDHKLEHLQAAARRARKQSLSEIGAICIGDDDDEDEKEEEEEADNNNDDEEVKQEKVADVGNEKPADLKEKIVDEIVNLEPTSSSDIKAVAFQQNEPNMILGRQSTTSLGSNLSAASKVIFETGADDEDELNQDEQDLDRSIANLDDIINDVGEIDLDLDKSAAGRASSTKSVEEQQVSKSTDVEDDDDDEDMISDGLLTSLTDAAINNLSQLAALQERCESQQQHSSTIYQQTTHQQPQRPSSSSLLSNQLPPVGTVAADLVASGPLHSGLTSLKQPVAAANSDFTTRDPFSSTSLANQAAIAINAAVNNLQTSSMIAHNQRPASSTNSMSPDSTIQADLRSRHPLASFVAAAAVAAAAANSDQQQHSHHTQLNSQTRLISSAIASPDFYHSLHHPHAQQNINQQQQQQQSPSALHFSPSTSVTPSPSSLMAQSRRSVASNASSSLLSPIASPNYLRRQFMPDRLPLLSPSPSSGLTTGSSSGTSSSLAHILHLHQHQQQQQRSASALAGTIMSPSTSTPLSSGGSTAVSPLMSNKNSSQARLNNMQIRHKFGYLGSSRAQFNSPHGFCLGLNQEIVVADTNNHRVCIFDKSGTYITQFGTPGKEEGQLWNPRKVAILHRSSNHGHLSGTTNSALNLSSSHHHLQHNQSPSAVTYSTNVSNGSVQNISQPLSSEEPLYVVCDRGAERSRMQLFTKDGAFIKKIGIHYIDIVAGLAITQNGLIIVVDSVSPTVYIINGETGILNGWFDCSGHMKEPSDIAVKSDVPGNEYFICDFKGHCVVVFSEQGEYLRKIGHDGLTSYPNGIDISDDGDILVGDSHGNRFHVVVFDRNGNFVSQFECPHVKVSRCCGLKITREGYIVTLAKNNHHVLVLDTIHI